MTVKMSVSITDQQAEYAKKQVAEGRFSSTSAVIQSALEAKRQEDEEYEAWKAGFEAEMLRRRREEKAVPSEEMDRRIEKMLEEKRKQYGLED